MTKASDFYSDYLGYIDKSKGFTTLVYAKKYCESLTNCVGLSKDEVDVYYGGDPDFSLTAEECYQYFTLVTKGNLTFMVLGGDNAQNSTSGCQMWEEAVVFNPVFNDFNCSHGRSIGCIKKEAETKFYVILRNVVESTTTTLAPVTTTTTTIAPITTTTTTTTLAPVTTTTTTLAPATTTQATNTTEATTTTTTLAPATTTQATNTTEATTTTTTTLAPATTTQATNTTEATTTTTTTVAPATTTQATNTTEATTTTTTTVAPATTTQAPDTTEATTTTTTTLAPATTTQASTQGSATSTTTLAPATTTQAPTAVTVSVTFDEQIYVACQGEDVVEVTWNGNHNIQEVTYEAYQSCSSSGHIGSELVGYYNSGHKEIVNVLANPGQVRHFICVQHCLNNAKFTVLCPALTTTTSSYEEESFKQAAAEEEFKRIEQEQRLQQEEQETKQTEEQYVKQQQQQQQDQQQSGGGSFGGGGYYRRRRLLTTTDSFNSSMAEYSVDNTVSFVSAYVPEIREADEDNNNVPIIFDWANKETLDGDPYGDQTTQINVLLLYSPEDPCKDELSEDNIDKCCTWTDFTDSIKSFSSFI